MHQFIPKDELRILELLRGKSQSSSEIRTELELNPWAYWRAMRWLKRRGFIRRTANQQHWMNTEQGTEFIRKTLHR